MQWIYWICGIGLAIAALVACFIYLPSMQRAEVSTGFSMQDLVGKIGEVTVAIPAKGGYGEVLIKVGGSFTNQIAGSFSGEPIPEGERVVIIKAEPHTLYVSLFDVVETRKG
ncbi:NfeD family protein [Tumebacillus flagellatus]|uniref:Uncharacterized protein n=1 Tax=Tumebacillus flagellatus TaxID=1157490 RepID=A0A074LJM7_9BACL|nr:NfeD family protein [Tumebacillus flagellatus]KEO82376.1 hypothetical protein EL26_15745 [Tumebacillus flagellatus]